MITDALGRLVDDTNYLINPDGSQILDEQGNLITGEPPFTNDNPPPEPQPELPPAPQPPPTPEPEPEPEPPFIPYVGEIFDVVVNPDITRNLAVQQQNALIEFFLSRNIGVNVAPDLNPPVVQAPQLEDKDYLEFATSVGLKIMACRFDQLDPAQKYKVGDFSAGNHFAHIAFRRTFKELDRANDTI